MRFSLRFILALSLAGLQFFAITIVVTTFYVTSERAMLDHARGLLKEAGEAAKEHSRGFLEPARETVRLSSRMVRNGIVSGTDPSALESFLYQQLQTDPQIAGAYYGDEAGNFTYVMRSGEPGPFRTKTVRVGDDSRTTELVWRDFDYTVVDQTFDPEDRFDPRSRPWYINAKEARSSAWTAPYIFFSSQQPGISVASPVIDALGDFSGVFGVDIEISDISSFLSEIAISENGMVLILNENGDVIAHPDPNQLKVMNSDGSVSFIQISEIDDPIPRAAFAKADLRQTGTEGGVQSNFEYDKQNYLTLLLPMEEIDLPWTIAIFAPEDDFIQGIKDNRLRNIWIAAVVAVLTGLAGVTLAELILRPVRAFAVRTAFVSQGEISASEPLPKTYNELQRANQTLIDEIAQRRESEAKIQDLNQELSHFSRVNLMGQMATGLAHELSQPLTAITQNVDAAITTASQDEHPNQELLEILNELDNQAHQGGDIVRALRGFVRKSDGQATLFDFGELLDQTCRLMRHETQMNNVSINVDLQNIPPVRGNRVEIAQVLTNLMRNSIEAMVEANTAVRRIDVVAVPGEECVQVSVSDTGPGVDPGVQLFKQFESSKPDGMGLGLSICRRIIESNNGRLWYDSESVEKPRFCFTLPI